MSIFINYPPLLEGRGGILFYLCPSVRPSVHPRYFSSHFSLTIDDRNLIYGHKHHIGIPYCGKRLDPSDSYFLFADLVRFYTHWTYMHIFVTFFSATIDGRDLIFGHKLHIGTPYRGKRFLDSSDSYFLFADFVDFYTH